MSRNRQASSRASADRRSGPQAAAPRGPRGPPPRPRSPAPTAGGRRAGPRTAAWRRARSGTRWSADRPARERCRQSQEPGACRRAVRAQSTDRRATKRWDRRRPMLVQPHGLARSPAVSFAQTRVAWLVGDDGTILKTTNGGSSFGVQTSNTCGQAPPLGMGGERAACLRLRRRRGGMADRKWRSDLGSDRSRCTRVGGAGTGTTSITRGNFLGIHAVADKVMVVGWNGAVLLSGDRGAHWKRARDHLQDVARGLARRRGFAIVVGADGAMFTNPPGPTAGPSANLGTSVSERWTGAGWFRRRATRASHSAHEHQRATSTTSR